MDELLNSNALSPELHVVDGWPRIRMEPPELWLEFPFSSDYVASVHSGDTTQKTTQETTRRTTLETREETRGKTRGKILRLLADAPSITTAELAEQIGITAKGIEWQFGKLKAERRIRRVGPAKGGHWDVIENPDE